jgi:hypothetical protein
LVGSFRPFLLPEVECGEMADRGRECRMVWPQRALLDCNRAFVERLRFGVLTLCQIEIAQVVQVDRQVGMPFPFVNGQCLHVKRLGFGVAVLLVVQGGEIVEGPCGQQIILGRLMDGDGALVQRLCVGDATLRLVAQGKIVDCFRQRGIVGTQSFSLDRILLDGKRTLEERLGFDVAAPVKLDRGKARERD